MLLIYLLCIICSTITYQLSCQCYIWRHTQIQGPICTRCSMQPLQLHIAGRISIFPRSYMESHSCEVAPNWAEDDNLLRMFFMLSSMRAFTCILPSGEMFFPKSGFLSSVWIASVSSAIFKMFFILENTIHSS